MKNIDGTDGYIHKINVSELPEQLTGTRSPFDAKNSMSFGVEVWNYNLNS